jgi:hypothetical protein
MAYIASTPTNQNFIAGTDQFTGNGSSTNWTLSRFVNSTNDIQVTVANVVQNPTSYSVSGNTLTISPAVSNGTVFYVRYMSTTLQSISPGQGSVQPSSLSTGGPSWDISGNLTVTGAVTSAGGQIRSGTAVASTSGTSIDFTGIPSWVKRVTVMFNGVSTNGASLPIIQLGTSSGVENTGYSAMTTLVSITSNTTRGVTSSTGFATCWNAAAAETLLGYAVIDLLGSNIWVCNGTFYQPVSIANNTVAGGKTLSGTLDRVRITTVNGTDTFDAGSINILYE